MCLLNGTPTGCEVVLQMLREPSPIATWLIPEECTYAWDPLGRESNGTDEDLKASPLLFMERRGCQKSGMQIGYTLLVKVMHHPLPSLICERGVSKCAITSA